MKDAAVRQLLDEAHARPPREDEPAVDGLRPSFVLEPDSREACTRALSLCRQEELAVVPLGAGTRLHVGNPPTRLDVYLSTRHLTGVHDYQPADLTVGVDAGTPLEMLQARLREENQFLPLDPPRAESATIGGIFALGEPGARRRPGARPRDLLLGFEGVLPDGTSVKSGGRVVKNVAGYELTKLFVGSAGTLLLMTRAYVRIRALPEAVSSLGCSFHQASNLGEVVGRLQRLAIAPEATAVTTPRFPCQESSSDWDLFLRFEGLEVEVEAGLRAASEQLTRFGPRRLDGEAGSTLWKRLQDFPVDGGRGDDLGLCGQVAPARTMDLAEAWQDGGPVLAYPEGGLVYCAVEEADALAERRRRVRAIDGNGILERAPTDVKTEDVYGETPGGFALMTQIKKKLDPTGVFSPGRFVGRL